MSLVLETIGVLCIGAAVIFLELRFVGKRQPWKALARS